jgi:glycosyltransferase involved in cell wall biosynthesis
VPKILYINTNATLGGAELVLLDLFASLRAARPGWRLELLIGEDGPLRAEAERLGVACRVRELPPVLARLGDAGVKGRAGKLALAAKLPLAAPAALGYLNGLGRAIGESGPDWVHTNGMKAHVLGAWATPRRVPVLWHLHDYLGSRAAMARLLKMSSRRKLRAVAVSRSVAEDAARVLGTRVSVRTIYNAADLARFAPGPGDGPGLDAASGLPRAAEGTVRVGLVATFARWKGQEVFLEAAARVPADRPARFYVVGGPIYRSAGSQWSLEELKGRAESLGLGSRVGVPGFRDPAEAMRALDVVVHASTRPEPFGRVIVEGMACGRAVVAIRGGGSAELFADGDEALGVPPEDPAALASAIDRLILDPELRRRLGASGRRAAEARFDRERLAASWSALYESSGGP